MIQLRVWVINSTGFDLRCLDQCPYRISNLSLFPPPSSPNMSHTYTQTVPLVGISIPVSASHYGGSNLWFNGQHPQQRDWVSLPLTRRGQCKSSLLPTSLRRSYSLSLSSVNRNNNTDFYWDDNAQCSDQYSVGAQSIFLFPLSPSSLSNLNQISKLWNPNCTSSNPLSFCPGSQG